VDAGGGGIVMESVSDELRAIMRARRHLAPDNRILSPSNRAPRFKIFWEISSTLWRSVWLLRHFSSSRGIVIMNIMLVTVTERTREIGVRKALGAKRKDILLQFLIESALLASIGESSSLVGHWHCQGCNTGHRIPVRSGLVVDCGGVDCVDLRRAFFGIYPAHKASALDPITALRAEL